MMCRMKIVFVPPNATRSVSGGVMITIFSRTSAESAARMTFGLDRIGLRCID